MDLREMVDDAHDAGVRLVGTGRQARSVPLLGEVPLNRLGVALATVDGEVIGAGDCREPFSVQSLSKVFSLALALAQDGESLWKRVRRQPSSLRYDALTQLDVDHGVPRNPFVNAGALVVVDRLMAAHRTESAAVVLELLRTESGNPAIRIDPRLAASERGASHRNAAAALLMASHGRLEHEVAEVLDQYIDQCAIAASCVDLAQAGLFLARGGRLGSGRLLLSAREASRLNAVVLTCGTYEAAGDVACQVGAPVKSGIGGGVLAVFPGHGTVCAWSPGLDEAGNSVAGMAVVEEVADAAGWSVF
ncbi:glutaminase A [Streptomyces sp. H39-S7]|uniref:glutaminase A n=1 Tax=Streptomyces sp. H39-S7 TaxID=3004357 RepID=UPI0022AF5E8C|nr:glutaminase A [Streptomyces sp. H39-S7]MCZ4119738.1 glutaminase A [Streptomyces sp. H39-S7]